MTCCPPPNPQNWLTPEALDANKNTRTPQTIVEMMVTMARNR